VYAGGHSRPLSVNWFLCLILKSTAQNAITSSNSSLKEKKERSSIVADRLPWKTKSPTCFALRGERFASSSRLMVLSLLGYKDGTRTIEMILVSTVLTPKEITNKSHFTCCSYASGRKTCKRQRACAIAEISTVCFACTTAIIEYTMTFH